MTKYLLLLAASSGIVLAGCIPVTGNRILGRDLALADPHFSALPATLTVAFAPAPGAKRIFAAMELQRLARANGISVVSSEDICFELPMLHLREEDAITAMRRSLPLAAVLNIVELANFEVPLGRLEFPLEGLEPATAPNHGIQLWRGYVRYSETLRMATWARVEVTVQYKAVVATKDLSPDTPIGAGSLRLETRTGPLEREKPATRIEEVQGRISRRALKAGSEIPLATIVDAPTVRRGDPVNVEVLSGPAHISFEAVAESSGHAGDIVELRNPANGKTFRARLNPGPGALLVIPSGQRL